MGRVDKHNYYLDLAEVVLERGTCLRRNHGAVIVKNDELVASGYAGAPRGRKNCTDLQFCQRQKLDVPRGERYELCRSVHAEQNAIISARRSDMIDSTLYLVGKDAKSGDIVADVEPCLLCKRMIINAGIKYVVLRRDAVKYEVVEVDKAYVQNDESLIN